MKRNLVFFKFSHILLSVSVAIYMNGKSIEAPRQWHNDHIKCRLDLKYIFVHYMQEFREIISYL